MHLRYVFLQRDKKLNPCIKVCHRLFPDWATQKVIIICTCKKVILLYYIFWKEIYHIMEMTHIPPQKNSSSKELNILLIFHNLWMSCFHMMSSEATLFHSRQVREAAHRSDASSLQNIFLSTSSGTSFHMISSACLQKRENVKYMNFLSNCNTQYKLKKSKVLTVLKGPKLLHEHSKYLLILRAYM